MTSLPYVTSPGNIQKALLGIKAAAVPERVSQDFVKTILKIPGGSGDQMTAFLKKLGFANSDGTPSEAYRKFRNPASSGSAVAAAIRRAYAPLYVRNEYMHELNDSELLGLVVEETGEAHDSNPVKLTVSCIKHLKNFADFNMPTEARAPTVILPEDDAPQGNQRQRAAHSDRNFEFRLGYTINLNLPATSDAAVFDAIFKSLKTHLLREDDA
ncbi:DUF5343 domain-containing protein [Enterovirga aerilata]|uniref:DUF5343 domain-containing protein n=1 Tax=Enterovirga aerilata TaxID=2730920 RepID=A0A849IFK2_9HYPH|nr:DUF5343 domain-containing protein [Enterovirga sp. DB1703]NNM74920.1 DUF5343 domain-containing protein [Enterovirga sp. DB1703]